MKIHEWICDQIVSDESKIDISFNNKDYLINKAKIWEKYIPNTDVVGTLIKLLDKHNSNFSKCLFNKNGYISPRGIWLLPILANNIQNGALCIEKNVLEGMLPAFKYKCQLPAFYMKDLKNWEGYLKSDCLKVLCTEYSDDLMYYNNDVKIIKRDTDNAPNIQIFIQDADYKKLKITSNYFNVLS